MEIYGFNERAMRHAERAGFTREGVRRKAYWRDDEWVDGVLYGLVAEDLDATGSLPVRGRLRHRTEQRVADPLGVRPPARAAFGAIDPIVRR